MNQATLRRYARLFMVLAVLQALVSFVLGFVNPELHLLTVAGAANVIVLFPWFAQSYQLFSAWTPATASVIVGANLHSWGTVLRYPNDETVTRIFLLSRDVNWLIDNSWLYIAGLVMLTFSYALSSQILGSRNVRAVVQPPAQQHLQHRAVPVAVALLTVATVSLGIFVWQTGGLSGNSLSAKRTVIPGVSFDPAEFRTFGYLRFFNAGAVVATSILLYAWRDKVLRPRYTAALIFSIALSIAYPFYASNRSDVIGVVLALLVVAWVINIRLPAISWLAIVSIPLIVLGYSTIARNGASASPSAPLAAVAEGLLEPLLATQNFADIAKTAHIAAAVPEQLEHRNGSTYAAWLVAPVPRAVWPSKPIIGTGPLIGTEIYGNVRSGVPPGLFGEAVLNFGPLGVPAIAMLFGFVIAQADRWIYSRQNDPAAVIMYAVGAFRVGEFALGQSAGEALLNSALGLILAYPATTFWLARERANRRGLATSKRTVPTL